MIKSHVRRLANISSSAGSAVAKRPFIYHTSRVISAYPQPSTHASAHALSRSSQRAARDIALIQVDNDEKSRSKRKMQPKQPTKLLRTIVRNLYARDIRLEVIRGERERVRESVCLWSGSRNGNRKWECGHFSSSSPSNARVPLFYPFTRSLPFHFPLMA